MGVDYTAKAAYGFPVGDMSCQSAEEIDEALPSGLSMIEFGSANYGGARCWVLGVSVGSSDFARGGSPTLVKPATEAVRKKILKAVERHGLPTIGELGLYIGGLVW